MLRECEKYTFNMQKRIVGQTYRGKVLIYFNNAM